MTKKSKNTDLPESNAKVSTGSAKASKKKVAPITVNDVSDAMTPAEASVGKQTDAAHEGGEFNQLVNHHYLTEEQFGIVSETLQRNLATSINLYLKFKKYHWDIRGRFFRDLHLAYDEFIDEIFPSIDEQAERLVALGGSPKNAPEDLARYSVVKVPTETVRDARTQVADLVSDLSRVGKGYRDDSGTVDDAEDHATADMYNGYAGTIDKIRWMLQAMMDDEQLN
ncbi:Dps family protein [Deinococcus detaillensis]|nr:Dps family protein [Deinococcus detaillensis]